MKRSIFIILSMISLICLTGCANGTKTAFIMTQQLHIKYPVIQTLKDKAVQDRINKTIYSTVFKLRNDNAKELKKHEKDYSYYVQSTVSLDNARIFSAKFEECLSIPFYAHPYNAVYAVTVNKKDGSNYRLRDLFLAGVSWEASLNGFLKKSIDEKEKKTGVPPLEIFKGIDREQEFYLEKDSMIIFWQEARYFPRYLGPLTIKVPYKEL